MNSGSSMTVIPNNELAIHKGSKQERFKNGCCIKSLSKDNDTVKGVKIDNPLELTPQDIRPIQSALRTKTLGH